jgi:drug/metabolite transporter (DMT)-like permease
MALSFYVLLVLLSWQPITFVIPASALSYVVGTLGAKYILGEDISSMRWAGVILVCMGVALVAAG